MNALIDSFCENLRDLVAKGDLEKALTKCRESLRNDSENHNAVIEWLHRYNTAKNEYYNEVITKQEYTITVTKISRSFLDRIGSLREKEFKNQGDPGKKDKTKIWKIYASLLTLSCIMLIIYIGKTKSPSPCPVEVIELPIMKLISGGAFNMGSTIGDTDEKPLRRESVDSFFLSPYEVSVAEFNTFIEATEYTTDAEKNGGSSIWKGPVVGAVKVDTINWRHDSSGEAWPNLTNNNYPVVHVSCDDAKAYCKWLSAKAGRKYRLPTEIEWEYAAGNGNKHTKYSWGNAEPRSQIVGNILGEEDTLRWLGDNIATGHNDGELYSLPVGSFAPNQFGLYDMSGNVSELCIGSIGKYAGACLFRGGSFATSPVDLRVAKRSQFAGSNVAVGFRIARDK